MLRALKYGVTEYVFQIIDTLEIKPKFFYLVDQLRNL